MHAVPSGNGGGERLVFGTAENVKIWIAIAGGVISTISTIAGLSTVLIRFEHRTTATEMNTAQAVQKCDALERRAGVLEDKMDAVKESVSQAAADRAAITVKVDTALTAIKQIDRKLDRRLPPEDQTLCH